jgi:hypothetical protein
MASSHEFGSIRHLAGRFFDALLPFGPPEADERWVDEHLLPGEQALWRRMSGPDRRHAVGVARRTVDDLSGPEGVGREVVAAALLHDVGKVEAGLGTWARAGVTFAGMAFGRERLVGWSGASACSREAGVRPTLRRRIGLYLRHDRVGAGLLADAGSDPLTVAWAGEHHRPQESWTVGARVGAALKLADDD